MIRMHLKAQLLSFDGPEDFHKRIDDESLNMDAQSILVMRGAGPIGYPGGAEVNMALACLSFTRRIRTAPHW